MQSFTSLFTLTLFASQVLTSQRQVDVFVPPTSLHSPTFSKEVIVLNCLQGLKFDLISVHFFVLRIQAATL